MKIAIIANGTIKNYEKIKNRIKEYEYIICVDGGIEHAFKMDIVPDLIIGDLDSAARNTIQYYEGLNVEIETFPSEKDFTDTHLAMNIAIGKRADEIGMFGVTGNRIDHSLANMMLFWYVDNHGIKCKIIDDHNEMFLADDVTILKKRVGEVVSLISLTQRTKIKKLEGFKYPLEDTVLYQWGTLGISNEIVAEEGKIIKGSGQLLVVRSCD